MFIGQAAKDLSATPTRKQFFENLFRTVKIQTDNGEFAVVDRVVQFPLVMREFRDGVAGYLNLKNEG